MVPGFTGLRVGGLGFRLQGMCMDMSPGCVHACAVAEIRSYIIIISIIIIIIIITIIIIIIITIIIIIIITITDISITIFYIF